MKDCILTLVVMVIVTLAAAVYKTFTLAEPSIVLLYVLGTVFIARFASKRIWGGIATLMSVLLFNYFFVEPIYSLAVNSKEYISIFAMMLVVSMITSALTDKVKQEAKVSREQEQHTKKLYGISHHLLMAQNLEQTKLAVAVSVAEILNYSTILYTVLENDTEEAYLERPFIYGLNKEGEREQLALLESEKDFVKKSYLTKEAIYSRECGITYLPIIGQEAVFGVIGLIGMNLEQITNEEQLLLKAIMAQMTIALEREESVLKQQQLNILVESEQLKSNMLRAISHDIRTPLTGILGATSTLIKGQEQLREDKKTSLLKGVYEDALWLVHSVENILNITRLDDGRLILHKHSEAVEEIIESVMEKLNKRDYHQLIEIHLPEELVMVSMDAILMVQVVYNLLDNAIKYTPDESVIDLYVKVVDGKVVFSIEDRGMGIHPQEQKHIFETFYRVKLDKNRERSGIGLGLTICKGIIEAHGGNIIAFNNEYGGATFRFELPIEGDCDGRD